MLKATKNGRHFTNVQRNNNGNVTRIAPIVFRDKYIEAHTQTEKPVHISVNWIEWP